MPSDRLAALLRQRHLLAGHLAWLDAEITEASGLNTDETLAPPASPSVSPAPPAPLPSTAIDGPQTPGKLKDADPEALARANALADSLLKDYSARNTDTPQSTRRGCLMLALAVGLLGVAGLMAINLIFFR